MTDFKLFVSSIVLTLAGLFLVSVPALAQSVNDFVITSFDASYVLNNKDPQGYLEITESITLDYSGQNRGILRVLPNTYKGNDLSLKIVKVVRDDKIEPYVTYEENNNTIIRIGDVGTYITGVHMYELTYSLENVITFYDDYDEFYWDINGDQWGQEFESVNAKLTYDTVASFVVAPACFTGSYASTDKNCSLQTGTNSLEASTLSNLLPGQTLTIVQSFDKGYFTPLSWSEKHVYVFYALPVVLIQIIAIAKIYRKWRMYGKDYKSRGVIAPYFERPKGLSVMQANYIAENKLTPRHISAAIIDLAIRGYIKIVESKEGRKTNHTLTLLKLPDETVSVDEKILVQDLFNPMQVGAATSLESKKNKLYKTLGKLTETIDELSIKKGFYENSPKHAWKKLIPQGLFGALAAAVGFLFGNVTASITIVTSILLVIIMIIFLLLMSKRSVAGNMMTEHIKGLELYLDMAEKDRIKMQDAVAAPLAPKSGEPTRDIKFFEKLLPFAVAAGVEKTWAKAFSDIYTQPPEWFQGNWTTFNSSALASSLSDTTKVTTASFSAPSSSGTSGSGGGGFSGGGGGGGGGGGW